MGRDYIVEGVVVKYLSNLRAFCVTGLLIGQESSSQRDFVVLTMRTPQKDTEGLGSPSVSRRAGISLDHLDLDVVTEHVSRVLQGGFSVFGIFLVTPPELPKETQNTLRQLSMTQTKHISNPGNTTSLNFILIGDFRAKPADWKYQWWGCTSWPMFTCSVKLDLLFPVLEMHVFPQDMEKCVKEELQTWAKQIEDGLCLINGKTMPDEYFLVSGKTYGVKIQITPKVFYTTNMNIMSSRVEMFLEDILIERERTKIQVFASLPGTGLCVCDYMFRDECVSDVSDHLNRDMPDMPENNIGTSQELKAKSTVDAPPKTPSED
uniref:Protein odr-4 homolog n=1 Tax=Oncorhynchus mykiss TaxID=8022 RepID=A0A8C7V3D1_ONCMY